MKVTAAVFKIVVSIILALIPTVASIFAISFGLAPVINDFEPYMEPTMVLLYGVFLWFLINQETIRNVIKKLFIYCGIISLGLPVAAIVNAAIGFNLAEHASDGAKAGLLAGGGLLVIAAFIGGTILGTFLITIGKTIEPRYKRRG